MGLAKQEKDRSLCLLKRRGCHGFNLNKLKEEQFNTDKLLKERKGRKHSDGKNRVCCSLCLGYFVKEHLAKHKRVCMEAEKTTVVPAGIRFDALKCSGKYSDDYKKQILKNFWEDDCGKLCRSDTYIKEYGFYCYRSVVTQKDKVQQKLTTIKQNMRTLAKRFMYCKAEATGDNEVITSSLDMFKCGYFQYFRDAINIMFVKEDGGQKSGAKKNLSHLLNNVLKHLKGKLTWEKKKEQLEEVKEFEALLKYFWPELFHTAEYNCLKRRQEELRRPKRLPREDDVKKLRDYSVVEIQKLANEYDFLNSSQYIRLRDLVVCRLTLYNARRGGEPSRLTLKEWTDAEEGIWLDESRMGSSKKSASTSELLTKFKLAYQSGKCINQMVPNLIPDDVWDAIKILVDPQVREVAGVHKDNSYIFLNVQNSPYHASGWKSVANICQEAD